MKMSERRRRKLYSAARFALFFLSSAVLVTCCLLLFLSYMKIDKTTLRQSATITFFNVIFLSLLLTLVDWIYRRVTVERHVKRILEATEKITDGDFSIRIEPVRGQDSVNEFDKIINGINKMTSELSGVETLRADFTANVSHELKTPLAVIQNYGTLLQTADLSEEKRIEYAKAITNTSKRLANLITNILKLNRLENQQIFPNTKPYNLGEQLIDCLLSFESVWEKKNIEIETDIDEEIEINADEELLSLVWNNLISNAMKFTPDGGRVTVELKRENELALVTVSDTGCGMSRETGEHIFEKFYQGDTSHAAHGNGLGLALVKRIMKITDSEISVESILGKGSKFYVKIKL